MCTKPDMVITHSEPLRSEPSRILAPQNQSKTLDFAQKQPKQHFLKLHFARASARHRAPARQCSSSQTSIKDIKIPSPSGIYRLSLNLIWKICENGSGHASDGWLEREHYLRKFSGLASNGEQVPDPCFKPHTATWSTWSLSPTWSAAALLFWSFF